MTWPEIAVAVMTVCTLAGVTWTIRVGIRKDIQQRVDGARQDEARWTTIELAVKGLSDGIREAGVRVSDASKKMQRAIDLAELARERTEALGERVDALERRRR